MKENKKSVNGLMEMLDRLFCFIDIIIYICMILVVLLQVFARVCLPKVPAWTEEVSRYLQVYLVAFGAGMAIKYNAFVSVDTIFHFLKRKQAFYLNVFNNCVVFVLFAVFFWYSVDMVQLGRPKSAVSIPSVTMDVVYVSMLLMSAGALFATVRKLVGLVSSYKMEVQDKCS